MCVLKRFRAIGFLILYLFSNCVCSQNTYDYQKVFGENYSEALAFIKNNRWISDSIAIYGVDPQLAISIVFPELIRYSVLKDIIETHGLEVLYVQYGSKYADFSIGRFQIKPSFASRLEKDWDIHIKELKHLENRIPSFDTTDNAKNRIQRIKRLKNENWQVKYLVMFIKLNEQKPEITEYSLKQKLLFLASAYNVGYWYKADTIQSKGAKNYYHTNLIRPEVCYNYASISLYHYEK